MDDNREQGVQLMGEVLGQGLEAGLRDHMASDDFSRQCGVWAADFAYGPSGPARGWIGSCAVARSWAC